MPPWQNPQKHKHHWFGSHSMHPDCQCHFIEEHIKNCPCFSIFLSVVPLMNRTDWTWAWVSLISGPVLCPFPKVLLFLWTPPLSLKSSMYVVLLSYSRNGVPHFDLRSVLHGSVEIDSLLHSRVSHLTVTSPHTKLLSGGHLFYVCCICFFLLSG